MASPTQRFNVAVIGYGLSAKVFHIPLIQAVPTLHLYGIVQRTPKPDDDAAAAHPAATIWRSADAVYADPAVDVVVVTSIPATHFAMCAAALRAGKHVVVEKPFVPTAAEAAQLLALAREHNRLLTVYQNRRWDADFVTVRHVLEQTPLLGDVAEFETHFDRHRPNPPPADNWKVADAPANGAIYDLGTHLIDQVYALFGMPARVTGFVGNQRRGVQGGSADSCTVLLHYPEGMLVTVKAGVISPEREQLRFWVRGTKGSFKKYHLDVQEDQLRAGKRPGDEGFGIDPEAHYATITTVEREKAPAIQQIYPTLSPPTYVEFYRLFAAALQGRGQVPVQPEDAWAVLRIIELALLSSKEGRTLAT